MNRQLLHTAGGTPISLGPPPRVVPPRVPNAQVAAFSPIARHGFAPPSSRVPARRQRLVIVGGGMAGLATAWWLRDLNPVILEAAPRFGGTSQGGHWNGIDYSVGAAYFAKPRPGSPLGRLLSDIDAFALCTEKVPIELHLFPEGLCDDFWSARLHPQHRQQLHQLRQYFDDVYDEVDHVFPDIPTGDPALREVIDRLDRQSFLDHLQDRVGTLCHPARSVLEHYCWTCLGGSMAEVSAAVALNFYADERNTQLLAPGGNAAIAECILEKVADTVPLENLQVKSQVDRVTMVDGGVEVQTTGPQGQYTLVADAVVLACPKAVVTRLGLELGDDKQRAAQRIQYRQYLVANALIQGDLPSFYDLIFHRNAPGDFADTQSASWQNGITDLILADYARPVEGSSVLTLHQALPYESEGANGSMERMGALLMDEIVPFFGLDPSMVVDTRFKHWARGIPLSRPGMIADGFPEIWGTPHAGRVFFAHQDNWMTPAIEASVGAAWQASTSVRSFLEG